MKFYGQKPIQREIWDFIVPKILEGENMNLAFIAPSGYGKTTLVHILLKFVQSEKRRYGVHLLCTLSPSIHPGGFPGGCE